jgi:HSP20 family molecular chaperone IbpA
VVSRRKLTGDATGSSKVVTAQAPEPREYYEQTFSQTIWLPQAVSPNGEGINAKLEDGVLKLWVPKPEPRDAAGFRIPIA